MFDIIFSSLFNIGFSVSFTKPDLFLIFNTYSTSDETIVIYVYKKNISMVESYKTYLP